MGVAHGLRGSRQIGERRSPSRLPLRGGRKMTTEIAIMNRQAVVLAADSAVTVARQRVWKSANKIFSLAPFNDIAVMANGSGDFVGYPWETIVKLYRLMVGNRIFDSVKDCAIDFISYLRSGPFHNKELEKISIWYLLVTRIEKI